MVPVTGNLLTSSPAPLVRRQLSRLSAAPSGPLIEEKGDAGVPSLKKRGPPVEDRVRKGLGKYPWNKR